MTANLDTTPAPKASTKTNMPSPMGTALTFAKHITRVTAEFIEKTGISYERDTTQEYFVKLLTHMKAQQWFCEALLRAGLIYLVKDEFDRVFLRVYAGKYDAYKSSFLAGGIYNVFLFWLTNGCPETPEALAEKLTGLLEK